MKNALLICLTLGLLTACSLMPQNVATQIEANDMQDYKTYSWLPDKAIRFVPEIAFEVVRKTDELLAAKGYQRLDTGDADFQLSFQLNPTDIDTEFRDNINYGKSGPGMTCQAGNCESTREHDAVVQYTAVILLQLKAQNTINQDVLWHTKSETSADIEVNPLKQTNNLNVKQATRIIGRMVKQMLAEVPAIN
jgi:hypothetical protein